MRLSVRGISLGGALLMILGVVILAFSGFVLFAAWGIGFSNMTAFGCGWEVMWIIIGSAVLIGGAKVE